MNTPWFTMNARIRLNLYWTTIELSGIVYWSFNLSISIWLDQTVEIGVLITVRKKIAPNDFNTIDNYLIFHLCNKNVNWMIHWFHGAHEYHRTCLALLNKMRLVLLWNSLNCIELSESFQTIYGFYSNSFLWNTTIISLEWQLNLQ